MKDGSLWFPVVPHEDRAFPHHLEVGPFPSDFVFYSILSPFLSADENLGRSEEVVYLFESKVVNLTCAILQVQDNGAYPLGIKYFPNAIELCIFLFS